MNLLTTQIKHDIENGIIEHALRGHYETAANSIIQIIDKLYDAIPDNKRISYGRVFTVKTLTSYLHTRFAETNAPVLEIASALFVQSEDYKVKGVSLGLLSLYGLHDYPPVLPYFEEGAASYNWDVREMAAIFFRKLIKKYPDAMKDFLMRLAQSENANVRRFVAETLRPVQENRWFYRQPDYPLSVLRLMFHESNPYPRTSVGNNLSDLARRLPELVYSLVEELVKSGDKHSCWIACRACRNLVKKEPVRVMDVLGVDEYKYKKRVYVRGDLERG
ncbi:MAG: hypothetical protein JXB48_15545 [Candidatus Latescibacteria bacterium]|nr:hypothetical protein [Candidatus Latescibacterota bacterium]